MSNSLLNKSAYLPREGKYIIVGDVHGCIDELRQLLLQNGFKIDSKGLIDRATPYTIILLGDFVDKANDEKIAETIKFIYQNYYHLNQDEQKLYLIMGNHEEMVYRYISKDPKLDLVSQKRKEEKEKYYNTATLLENSPALKEKFLKLYALSLTWLKYEYNEDFSLTLTHAPCQKKYLAQEDDVSHREMLKCASRSKNPGLSLDELIAYVHEEAEENQHYHIFGHLSQPNIRWYKNRICIDTSAIYGNRLSALILQENHFHFDDVPFMERQKAVTQHDNLLFDFDH